MRTSVVTIPKLRASGGCEIPAYGLGTWGMGGRTAVDTSDDARCLSAIEAAIEAGISHIDTAEMYGAGHAEELVGQAIRGFDRAQLFLASKAMAHHLQHAELIHSAEQSLKRLRTDYLDLYMIHHPSDVTPLEETLSAMDHLVRQGKVRYVGVSNFSKERLERARAASPQPIVANQVHYSLGVRDPEQSGLLDYCRKEGVLLVAWRPVDSVLYQPGGSTLVTELARKYQKTPVQIALNWLLSQEGVAVISRTTSKEHLQENLGTLHWKLEAADQELLRTQYEQQQPRSTVYSLR